MDKIELIKMCEKYYSQYMKSLKKISDVNRMEFVNLNGCYRHRWYQKAARITRRFIYFSIIYLVIKLYLNINMMWVSKVHQHQVLVP